MKKKLFLNDLKVKSFVTTYPAMNRKTIKGGVPAMGGINTDDDCGTYVCVDTYYCAGSGYANCSGTCGGGGGGGGDSVYSVCGCIQEPGGSVNERQGGSYCIGNGTLRCGG